MNRIRKDHGIDLYNLIKYPLDYLEYWVSGPRSPDLESALLSLLNQTNPKAPILTPSQCTALSQLRVVLCHQLSWYDFKQPRLTTPLVPGQFPVNTNINEEGYGLICRGVKCTELAFNQLHMWRLWRSRQNYTSDVEKEDRDTKKQGSREPRMTFWRKIHDRKYLAIGQTEVPKVVNE